MNKVRAVIVEVICAILLLLFLYAFLTKILTPNALRHDMMNQPFPVWFKKILVWFIPAIEVFIVIILPFEKTRRLALLISFTLMSLFTLYAALILLKVFPYVPCGCGGVIRYLSWPQHLVFNLFFMIISGLALWLRKAGRYKEPEHGYEKAFLSRV